MVSVDHTDYRLLKPSLVTDANQNRSAVKFDVLGLVVGTALMGKGLPATKEGDNLEGFEDNLTTKVIMEQIADPLNDPNSGLNNATTRII